MENGLQQQLQQLQKLQQLNPAMDELARSELFKPAPRSFSLEESTKLSYQRAKAFANAYGISYLYTLPPDATTDYHRSDA